MNKSLTAHVCNTTLLPSQLPSNPRSTLPSALHDIPAIYPSTYCRRSRKAARASHSTAKTAPSCAYYHMNRCRFPASRTVPSSAFHTYGLYRNMYPVATLMAMYQAVSKNSLTS